MWLEILLSVWSSRLPAVIHSVFVISSSLPSSLERYNKGKEVPLKVVVAWRQFFRPKSPPGHFNRGIWNLLQTSPRIILVIVVLHDMLYSARCGICIIISRVYQLWQTSLYNICRQSLKDFIFSSLGSILIVAFSCVGRLQAHNLQRHHTELRHPPGLCILCTVVYSWSCKNHMIKFTDNKLVLDFSAVMMS